MNALEITRWVMDQDLITGRRCELCRVSLETPGTAAPVPPAARETFAPEWMCIDEYACTARLTAHLTVPLVNSALNQVWQQLVRTVRNPVGELEAPR